MLANSPRAAVSRAGAARMRSEATNRKSKTSERQVAEANEKTTALNERIVSVLTGTTDQEPRQRAAAVVGLVEDYTDYYHGGSRPVSSMVDSSNDYIIPPRAVAVGRVFCPRHASVDKDRAAAD